MSSKHLKDAALTYHQKGQPGKIEVIPTKPHSTQKDLALAYSPGVAIPCIEIQNNPEEAYKYTAKGNLVAVISDGSAVLGLGNIGALASKPVMEGKGLLFKIFAGIDVFDIEVDQSDPDKFVETVKAIAPTFGGINLEDIKAPECFYIEDRLKKELDIPVMHDDQHGTAIISSAGLLNALELKGKKIGEVKLVVNGAGASAVSCTKLYISIGMNPENIVMVDSKGVINESRTDLNEIKKQFITKRKVNTLAEAVVDADIFLGLSVADVLSPEMLKSMAPNPIVFALANPNPEIDYNLAMKTRDDMIMATGRSDYPNQINNVLGFPYIFRGALDVGATSINEEMKIAAANALANLTKEPVPDEVNQAYNIDNLSFGKKYIIPKPFDPRLISVVTTAVAKAAIASNVAKNPIWDFTTYQESLEKRMGKGSRLIRNIRARAKANLKKVVFAEAEDYKLLKAAEVVIHDKIAIPILLGNVNRIRAMIEENQLDLGEVEIIDPRAKETAQKRLEYAEIYFNKRNRSGVTHQSARDAMSNRNYFSTMMVESGDADALISGLTRNYPDTVRPALEIIGKREGFSKVSGMHIVLTPKKNFFFADTTVNTNPNCQDLIDITLETVDAVKDFNVEPSVALLSYSNFGSHKGRIPKMVKKAVDILHHDYPELIVDGDIQANFAINNDKLKDNFPFSKLMNHPANTLIFPYLSASNITYKLINEIGGYEVIGPVLNGLKKSVQILQLGSSVREIINMVTIAALYAQKNQD